VGLLAVMLGAVANLNAQQYWNTNGVSGNWTDSNWGSSSSGPFSTGYTSGNNAFFTTNSSVTSATTTAGNITILNTGVTRLSAGTGINVSSSNGNVTISTTTASGTVISVVVSSSSLVVSNSPITTVGTISVELPANLSVTGQLLLSSSQNLVNGGISEDCTCLVNGVGFNDVNTAAKINAGIEVINVLSSFYQISCPVIIDGRESISKLIQTDAQIINLIVDSGCEKLTVK
jgi:hypothetical protein